jgi:excisionase family DNA binding protein
MDDFVTTAEAAELLGVSPRRVRAMVAAGRLQAQTVTARMLLIARADLKLFKKRKAGRPPGKTKKADGK